MGTFGEIRLVAFTTVPPDWAACNGQLLSIAQNQALFSILGTTYGGDGTSNFALPDLRGLVPMHTSSTLALGTTSGAEAVALTASQIPIHTHAVMATSDTATAPSPAGAILAAAPATLGDVYGQQTGLISMASQDVGNAGASQPHSNMQPFLVVNYIICTNGIFPEHA